MGQRTHTNVTLKTMNSGFVLRGQNNTGICSKTDPSDLNPNDIKILYQ